MSTDVEEVTCTVTMAMVVDGSGGRWQVMWSRNGWAPAWPVEPWPQVPRTVILGVPWWFWKPPRGGEMNMGPPRHRAKNRWFPFHTPSPLLKVDTVGRAKCNPNRWLSSIPPDPPPSNLTDMQVCARKESWRRTGPSHPDDKWTDVTWAMKGYGAQKLKHVSAHRGMEKRKRGDRRWWKSMRQGQVGRGNIVPPRGARWTEMPRQHPSQWNLIKFFKK